MTCVTSIFCICIVFVFVFDAHTLQVLPFFGPYVPSTTHLPLLYPKPMSAGVGALKPWQIAALASMQAKIDAAGELDQTLLMSGLQILRLDPCSPSWSLSLQHDRMMRIVLLPDAKAARAAAVAAAGAAVSAMYTVTVQQRSALQSVIGGRLGGGVPSGRLSGELYFKTFHALVAYLRDRLARSMLLCTADVVPLACTAPFIKEQLGYPVDVGALAGGFGSVRLGPTGHKLAASIIQQLVFEEQLDGKAHLLLGDAVPVAANHNAAGAIGVAAFVAEHAVAAKETRELWDAIPCAVAIERGRIAAHTARLYGASSLCDTGGAVIPCGIMWGSTLVA